MKLENNCKMVFFRVPAKLISVGRTRKQRTLLRCPRAIVLNLCGMKRVSRTSLNSFVTCVLGHLENFRYRRYHSIRNFYTNRITITRNERAIGKQLKITNRKVRCEEALAQILWISLQVYVKQKKKKRKTFRNVEFCFFRNLYQFLSN